MEPLNPREREALRVIRNYLAHLGRMPSLRELSRELGYRSHNASLYVLNRLEDKGYIAKKKQGFRVEPRKILRERESDNINTVMVPLLGRVPCGSRVMVDENVIDKFPISTRVAKGTNSYYLLIAHGDSMNKAGINDGDYLLIKYQECADDGDRVVAMISGEVTVKLLKKSGNVAALVPSSTNKDHKPILINDECLLRGIVVEVFPKEFFNR